MSPRTMGVSALLVFSIARVPSLFFLEPGPAGAEVGERRLGELLLEIVDAAEVFLDCLRHRADRLRQRAGSETAPVEIVVPHLRGVVEQRPRGLFDNVLQ